MPLLKKIPDSQDRNVSGGGVEEVRYVVGFEAVGEGLREEKQKGRKRKRKTFFPLIRSFVKRIV